jgi:hypothetical protein
MSDEKKDEAEALEAGANGASGAAGDVNPLGASHTPSDLSTADAENAADIGGRSTGPDGTDGGTGRAIGIAAVAVVSAGVAFVVARKLLSKKQPSADPTAARIQALMDEANRLLKELDAKKLG